MTSGWIQPIECGEHALGTSEVLETALWVPEI